MEVSHSILDFIEVITFLTKDISNHIKSNPIIALKNKQHFVKFFYMNITILYFLYNNNHHKVYYNDIILSNYAHKI